MLKDSLVCSIFLKLSEIHIVQECLMESIWQVGIKTAFYCYLMQTLRSIVGSLVCHSSLASDVLSICRRCKLCRFMASE